MNRTLMFATCALALLFFLGVQEVSAAPTNYTCTGAALTSGLAAPFCPQEPMVGDHVTFEWNTVFATHTRCHVDIISKTKSWLWWDGSGQAKVVHQPGGAVRCDTVPGFLVGTMVTYKW